MANIAEYKYNCPDKYRSIEPIIKRTLARDCTDEDLAYLWLLCDRLDMDPFRAKIYMVRRWDDIKKGYVATPQLSIEALRTLAQRTGERDGMEGPWWCGSDGVWRDVWLLSTPPAAAKVFVFRRGCSRPFVGIATYIQSVQKRKDGKITKFWEEMPALMLAKCAEAAALRQGFPDEVEGLYTHEEMPEIETIETTASEQKPLPTATEKPKKAIPARRGEKSTEAGATATDHAVVSQVDSQPEPASFDIRNPDHIAMIKDACEKLKIDEEWKVKHKSLVLHYFTQNVIPATEKHVYAAMDVIHCSTKPEAQ